MLESVLPAAMASAANGNKAKGSGSGSGNGQLILQTLRVFVDAYRSILPARRASLYQGA